MKINENVKTLNDMEVSKKYNDKFNLVLDYYTKDSIYDDEPFYDDYIYELNYENEPLYVYDEDEYPLSIQFEICNIIKRITIFVPYMEETYRNYELAKEGLEYTKELINKIFGDSGFPIEIFYNSK
jgi:hypothetical protein